MDLDQLRAFLCVARLGNLTRAATEMNISQPALSRSIQRLEKRVGRELFERLPRAMRLTEVGERFRQQAADAVALLEHSLAELADHPDRGVVQIGSIPTIAPYLLPRLMHAFAQRYPRVQLVLTENTTPELVDMCKQGVIDVMVAAYPLEATHLQVEELATEELYIVMPQDHPLATRDPLTIEDLRDEPFVLLNEAHCLTRNVEAFWERQAYQPIVVERVHQLAMVQELVSLMHGVSLVPEGAKRTDHAPDRVYRRLSPQNPQRTLVVAHNPYRHQSKVVRAFVGALRDDIAGRA